MPSARTSVGNKEYEYKKADNELAAQPQRAKYRRWTILLDHVAVAVALRHVVDRTALALGLSTVFFVTMPNGGLDGWTSMPFSAGRPAMSASGRHESVIGVAVYDRCLPAIPQRTNTPQAALGCKCHHGHRKILLVDNQCAMLMRAVWAAAVADMQAIGGSLIS